MENLYIRKMLCVHCNYVTTSYYHCRDDWGHDEIKEHVEDVYYNCGNVRCEKAIEERKI